MYHHEAAHLVGPAEWYIVVSPLRCWISTLQVLQYYNLRPFSIQYISLELHVPLQVK